MGLDPNRGLIDVVVRGNIPVSFEPNVWTCNFKTARFPEQRLTIPTATAVRHTIRDPVHGLAKSDTPGAAAGILLQ